VIARRDLLVGGACAASLGAAEWLRPRRVVKLMGSADLDHIVPRAFAEWQSTPGGDFVVPQSGNSLAVRLYAEQLMRVYTSPRHAAGIMLLIAYGGTQSDSLQLHRPESCYPAVGLPITFRALASLPVAAGVAIPGVVLTAQANQRVEDIAYWTRLGEYLPRSAGEQRRERLLTAMRGAIGDGLLVRASMLRAGSGPDFPLLTRFLGDLVRAVPASARAGLVGTSIARKLQH
jgi:EpsI family protein